MFSVAMAGVLVTMLTALIAAVRGPTVFDRILAVNMFGTKTILLIAVSGFLSCLLYTSPSPRDLSTSRMPSSA